MVSAIELDYIIWEHERSPYIAFKCSSCSKAKYNERGRLLTSMKLEHEFIERLVIRDYYCDRSRPALLPPYGNREFGGADCSGGCNSGDSNATHNCSNCKYATKVTLGHIKRHKSDYSSTRTAYLCSNEERMKKFDDKTAMAAYICCENYEEK